MKRPSRDIWTLVAILLLTIGTTVALTRQQANFNEHERLDKKACELALANRQLLRDDVEIHRQEHEEGMHPDGPVLARLTTLEQRLDRLIAETKVRCSQ